MKDYRLFLIDLDGTIYRGPDTIESGVRFVKRLNRLHKDYLFLTNNTTRTPGMVVRKLAGHGLKTDIAHVYTPSMATASYLLAAAPYKKIKVYIIGQIGLFSEILSHDRFELDDQKPDYVIVGMDTDLTYHKVRVASTAIRRGAKFISTNADLNLPSGNELLPGNGSQCAMIAASSGQKPLVIGKPEALIVNYALKKMRTDKTDAILVGDNYKTDIVAGFNAHVDQLLVLSGVTQRADLQGKKKPTITVDSLDQVLVDEEKFK